MTWDSLWIIAAISFAVFLIVAMGMAIGVMFGRRAISGSCGGLGNRKGADGKTACSLCENPAEACRELQDRSKADPGAKPSDEPTQASAERAASPRDQQSTIARER